MSKKKIDVDVDKKEEIFKEEVPEEELHSKIDVDDHIYIENKSSVFGNPVLMFLALALVLTALCSTFYGLLSLDSDLNKRDIGVIKNKYHLTVIHYNDSYGGTIKDFKDYTSFRDSFSYNFTIANKNQVDLGYTVSIEKNPKSTVDMSQVNYRLIKNGTTVQSGNFSNKKVNKIYDVNALAGTTDQYEIRIWSEQAVNGKSLTFKVNILV